MQKITNHARRCPIIHRLSHQHTSYRSIYIQRSVRVGYKNSNKCFHIHRSPNKQLINIRKSYIWIPPIWLRPLIRPLLVIIGSFIGGVILQLWKGHPPQWLLSESAEQAVVSGGIGAYAGRIVIGSIVFGGLYFTRFKNPLYTYMIGQTETNLSLASSESALPLNAKWDSRSANDSMKTRLQSMEKYLGAALSSASDGNIDKIHQRVDKIRKNGYNNAIKIALERAEFWAESGSIVKFENVLQSIASYKIEGGELNDNELKRIKAKAYGTRCSKLFADAQTASNKGDTSSCQKAIGEIQRIQNKFNGIFIEENKLDNVSTTAHKYHVSYMLDEARKIKQTGSRVQAKVQIEQARKYAKLHNIDFDESTAKQILN